MPKSFLTLIFDDGLEQAVHRLCRILSDAAICPPIDQRHRPHVTLAGFEVADAARCTKPLEELCRRRAPISIRLHHVGIFPERSVLFLQPRMTASLMKLHREVIEGFGAALSTSPTSPNFAIDNWTPHCTLADAVPQELVGTALALVQENWRVLEGKAVGIGVLVPPAIVDCFQCGFSGVASAGSVVPR
jgi:2'-5' RNA ligase